jgi:hypothetical protein
MPFGKLLPREEQYFTLFAQMTSYINDAVIIRNMSSASRASSMRAMILLTMCPRG